MRVDEARRQAERRRWEESPEGIDTVEKAAIAVDAFALAGVVPLALLKRYQELLQAGAAPGWEMSVEQRGNAVRVSSNRVTS